MELTGNTYTIVPHGWQRLLEGGRVVYISPDSKRLRNNEELLRHLTSPGTCKCGLRCPFSIDELFSFDPELISLPDSRPFNQNSLCRQANNLRLVKSRRPQATKKQVPVAGLHSERKKSKRESSSAGTLRLEGAAATSANVAQPIVQLQSLISHLNTMASKQSAEGHTRATISLQWLAAAGIQLQAPTSTSSLSGTSKPTQQIALMIPSSLAATSLTSAPSSERWRVTGKVRKRSSSRPAKQTKTSRTSSSSSSPAIEDSELAPSHSDDPISKKFTGNPSSKSARSSSPGSSLLQSLPVSLQTEKCIRPSIVTTSSHSLPDQGDHKEKTDKWPATDDFMSAPATSNNQSTPPCQTSLSQPLAVLPQASPSQPLVAQPQTDTSSPLLSPETALSHPLANSPQTGHSSIDFLPETNSPQPLAETPHEKLPSCSVPSTEDSSSQPLETLPRGEPSCSSLHADTMPSREWGISPLGGLISTLLPSETTPSQSLETVSQVAPSTVLSTTSSTLPQTLTSQQTSPSEPSEESPILLACEKSQSQRSPPPTLPEALPPLLTSSPGIVPSQPLTSLPQSGSSSTMASQETGFFQPLVAASSYTPPTSTQSSEMITSQLLVKPLPMVPSSRADILPDTSVFQPLAGPSSLLLPFETSQSQPMEVQPPVGPPFLGSLQQETGLLPPLDPLHHAPPGQPPQGYFPRGLSTLENLPLPSCEHEAPYQFLEPSIGSLIDPASLCGPPMASKSESDPLLEPGTGTFPVGIASSQAGSYTSQSQTGASRNEPRTSQPQTSPFRAGSSPHQTRSCDQSFHLHSSNANNNNVPFLTADSFVREQSSSRNEGVPVGLRWSKSPSDSLPSSYSLKSYNLRARSSSRDSSEPLSDKSATTSSGKSQSDDSTSVLTKEKNQLFDSVPPTAVKGASSFAYPALVCSEFNLRKRKERSSSVTSSDRRSSASPASPGSSSSIPLSRSKSRTSSRTHSRQVKSSETSTSGKSTGKVVPGSAAVRSAGKVHPKSAAGSTRGQSNKLSEEPASVVKKSRLPTDKGKHARTKKHNILQQRYLVSEFTVGDVVWAKAPQLPAWPGRIITHSQWTKDKLKPPPAGEVWVEWFGSETVSLVPVHNLHPLKEGYQSARGSIKKWNVKKINKAMQEAIVVLEMREQQKAAGANS